MDSTAMNILLVWKSRCCFRLYTHRKIWVCWRKLRLEARICQILVATPKFSLWQVLTWFPQALKEFLPQACIKLCNSEKEYFFTCKTHFFSDYSLVLLRFAVRFAKCLWYLWKNLPQENSKIDARIWQNLATGLNFLQHAQIFLYENLSYSGLPFVIYIFFWRCRSWCKVFFWECCNYKLGMVYMEEWLEWNINVVLVPFAEIQFACFNVNI